MLGIQGKRWEAIHHTIERLAIENPERPAVLGVDVELTRGELNHKSNQLANYLIRQGIRKGDVVAILVSRTPELLVVLLAVMKVGATYVPIEPDHAPDSIRYICSDSKLLFIITDCDHLEYLAPDYTAVINLSGIPVYDEPVTCAERPVEPGDICYIIYTSGTTGQPKGVLIEHKSLQNLAEGIGRRIEFTEGKTILSITSVMFDIFVLETLVALSKGLKVVFPNKALLTHPRLLANEIVSKNVDILQVTPSKLYHFLRDLRSARSLIHLSEILIGGEQLPLSMFRTLLQHTRAAVYNMYGPTETTVWSSICRLSPDTNLISIGTPIHGTGMYILGEDERVLPCGEIGELAISGEGLARGYLNKPELTRDKFAFHQELRERIYRTGDVAERLPDGTFLLHGRTDHQVKIKGYRVELGEIETALAQHDKVERAVVVKYENQLGDTELIAYYVLKQSGRMEKKELQEFLQRILPAYMLPLYYIQLSQFPENTNGKIDRSKLVDWFTL